MSWHNRNGVGIEEGAPMSTESINRRVEILCQYIVALVRFEGPDLSARQLVVFLTSYLEDEAPTVGELAVKLNLSGPAISRALDRLAEFDLVRRQIDPLDRRSSLAQRTTTGTGFLRDLKEILDGAGNNADRMASEGQRAGTLVGVT
jgi:DNA-binding MarR family transcriptional regulator